MTPTELAAVELDGRPPVCRRLRSPDDGTPASLGFYPDGTPKWIEHYANGELVSETRFPPPIGEA